MKLNINKTLKRNNKGVAMISVMIAIAFISVLVSAMLYMSVTNYAMKSANVRAKENFYETDGELVKVSSSIRNGAMSSSNPVNYIDEIKRSSDNTKYDCEKIAKLVYPDTALGAQVKGSSSDAYVEIDGDEIHFKGNGSIVKQTKTEDPTIIDNVTRYKLTGFEVSQTNASGFSNSVKSDITIDIYETSVTGGGSGGVGNMSLLLDSTITLDGDKLPSLTMTGNTFIVSYGTNNGSYTVPGEKALYMKSESRVNMVGDYNVVYGDIYLEGKASLCVYGDLTVYGDIILSENATLVLAGNGAIHMVKDTLPGKTVATDLKISGAAEHHLFPTDLKDKIDKSLTLEDFDKFAEFLNLKNGSTDDDGLLKKILQPVSVSGVGTVYITDVTKNINDVGGDSNFTKGSTDFFTLTVSGDKEFDGRSVGFGMIPANYDANLNGGHQNLLVINNSRKKVIMTKNAEYTTFLGVTPLKFDVQHGVILTKLGTSEFNYITAAKGDTESAYYTGADNPFNNIKITFDGGSYTGAVGDFFKSDCNSIVDEMFSISNGESLTGSKKYASTIYFKDYSRDN